MAKEVDTVRLSSKGQVVIPAGLRRRLRLKTGQRLRVRPSPDGGVTLTPEVADWAEMDRQLREVREWAKSTGRDFVEEFHERRRQERRRWETKRAQRRS